VLYSLGTNKAKTVFFLKWGGRDSRFPKRNVFRILYFKRNWVNSDCRVLRIIIIIIIINHNLNKLHIKCHGHIPMLINSENRDP
jgi:hypothetical protein